MAALSIPVSVAQWRKDSSFLMTQESGKRLSRRLWGACPVSLTTSQSGTDVWKRWQRPLSYTQAVCCVSAGSKLVPSFHSLLQVYQTELSWINTNIFASFFFPLSLSFYHLSVFVLFCFLFSFSVPPSLTLISFFSVLSFFLLPFALFCFVLSFFYFVSFLAVCFFRFPSFAISNSPLSFVSLSFFPSLSLFFLFLSLFSSFTFFCFLFIFSFLSSFSLGLSSFFSFLKSSSVPSCHCFFYLFISVVFLSPSYPFSFFVSFFVCCGVTWRRIDPGKAFAKQVSNLVLWDKVIYFVPSNSIYLLISNPSAAGRKTLSVL